MTLPLATLITERLTDLGINAHRLAVRLGYVNTNKGSRRLRSLMEGRLIGQDDLLSRLPAALEISPEVVARAVQAHWEFEAQAYRDGFVPHALIVTNRSVPSQITICAVMGGESARRISIDTGQPRASYARQALVEVNRRTDHGRREIPFFGEARNFVVNYEWCRAIRFDLGGQALEILPHAVRNGISEWAT